MSDLLECINDDWHDVERFILLAGKPPPVKGHVYTFAGWEPARDNRPVKYLFLDEYGDCVLFFETYFRPVVDGALDVFRALVKDPEQPLVDA